MLNGKEGRLLRRNNDKDANMKINILICDDDKDFLQRISDTVAGQPVPPGASICITKSSNPAEITDRQLSQYHIMFLDIDMDERSGMHGMYKLNVGSYALATVARALVAVAGYTGSGDVKMMLLFTAIAALGQGPWQGDMNAVIASCSEYTWLTKHKRVDGTMYSCTSLGVKMGGGLGTAITGWLLAFSNYDKALAVQPDSCINMLKLMYLVIPFVLDAIITVILSRVKVEEANDKIRAEMKN